MFSPGLLMQPAYWFAYVIAKLILSSIIVLSQEFSCYFTFRPLRLLITCMHSIINSRGYWNGITKERKKHAESMMLWSVNSKLMILYNA